MSTNVGKVSKQLTNMETFLEFSRNCLVLVMQCKIMNLYYNKKNYFKHLLVKFTSKKSVQAIDLEREIKSVHVIVHLMSTAIRQ